MTERDLVAELRTWEAAPNVRGEVRSIAKRSADEIERLRGNISFQDGCIAACHQEIGRLRTERDEWQHKWMAMAQASLLVGTMRLGDVEQSTPTVEK